MKKILFLYIALFAGAALQAQQEIGTHFLHDVWQSTVTNPAFVPEKKWTVALPGVHYSFRHEPGGLNTILKESNGQTVIDFGNLIDNMDAENLLSANFDIPTLEVAFRLGNLRLSLGHQTRLDAQLEYPKTFADLIWRGNAAYIGETVEFGPRANLFSYNEIGLGAAIELSKWTLGAKLKYLSGIGYLGTGASQASIYTDSDIYQLTLMTDYEIRTSSFLEINDLRDFNFNLSQDLGALFSKNQGFALDLGVRYQMTDRLELNLSALDLGQIEWKDGKTYHSQGNESYEGIDLSDFILNDSIEFDIKLDTLEDAFDFKEEATSFSTKLKNKIYLGGNYQLNDRLTVGVVYLLERLGSDNQHALGLNATARLHKMLALGVTYSNRYEQFDNIGVNALLQLGPVQIYGVADNILGFFDSSDINGRVGLNMRF